MKEHSANQSIQGTLRASDAEKVKPIYKKHKDHDLRIKSAKDAIGCMVTQEEHKILTEQTSLDWQRYIDSNIKVFDSKLQQWCQ